MKLRQLIFTGAVALSLCSFAQWQTTGSNIYFNSGNVGIGSSSPDARLTVATSSSLISRFISTQNGGISGLRLQGKSNDGSDVRYFDIAFDPETYSYGFGAGSYSSALPISSGLQKADIVVNAGGNVGIGTTNPSFNLTVGSNLNNPYQSNPNIAGMGIMSHGSGTAQGNLYLHRDDVTISANNILGSLLFTGADGGEQVGAEIRGVSAGNWSTGQSATDLSFFTTTSGSSTPTEKMTIKDNGSVGIGTSSPTHKLEVNGTIRTKEVKVEATNWPDYVFEPDYDLRSLEETAAYIKSNKHLPEVPSAKEMEANGVQLGEMNMLLLKKIEELTLYVIEQKKENEKQNETIAKQQAIIDSLIKE
ncbi:hypothetical protein [Ekhidna sp.]|uniref:hypothetical protein n=1 Tax=Ekhidna sp. TaxID=2608089 RepID=UPI003BA853EB